MRRTNDHGETFGAWLLAQKGREGLIGQLVDAAKADRGFPRDGDPEAVRKRLRNNYAEGDLFDAIDDAETDWLAY
ncbi:MAG: hypothetical protein PGN09_07770 [Sphingomonas fennica]